jgi:hypothetical protein
MKCEIVFCIAKLVRVDVKYLKKLIEIRYEICKNEFKMVLLQLLLKRCTKAVKCICRKVLLSLR